MPLGIIDTHAHYDDAKFDADRDELISALFANGDIAAVINVGCDVATSKRSVEFTEKYPNFYAWVGIHPCDCGKIEDKNRALYEIESLLSRPRVVGIGEIGLDFYWDDVPRDVQIEWFRAQMDIARRTGRPVAIHDRDAHGACFDVVRDYPDVRGVFHSYSGSAEMARDLVRRGWYISFSGVVTFKNAPKVREVAEAVPPERMLIETDCPYLSPEPNRGKRNDSRNLVYTSAKLAEIKGMTQEEFCAVTANNARSFLGVD